MTAASITDALQLSLRAPFTRSATREGDKLEADHRREKGPLGRYAAQMIKIATISSASWGSPIDRSTAGEPRTTNR